MPVRCSKCGGTNVQVAMWVRVNENKIMDDFGSWDFEDTKYCEDCDEHVRLIEPEFTMQQEVYELVWRLPDDRFYALCDRLVVTAEDVQKEIAGWDEPGEDPVVDERVARANIMVDRLRGDNHKKEETDGGG